MTVVPSISLPAPRGRAFTESADSIGRWFDAVARCRADNLIGCRAKDGRVRRMRSWRGRSRLWQVIDEDGRCGAYIKVFEDDQRLTRHLAAARWLASSGPSCVSVPAVLGACHERGMVASAAVAGLTLGQWIRRLARFDRLAHWTRVQPDDLADQLADGLNALHGMGSPDDPALADYRPAANAKRLREKFRRLCGHIGAPAEKLTGRMEEMAERLATVDAPSEPMIGDVSPDNLLLSDTGLCVVDLDDFGRGDRHRDGCFLMERLADAADHRAYARWRVRRLMRALAERMGGDPASPEVRLYRVEFLLDAWWSACRKSADADLPQHGRGARRIETQLTRLLDALTESSPARSPR